MSWVLRTWGCLNKRCRNEFESGDANPPCPKCGNLRVGWRPGGGHVLHGSTRNTDATLRGLATRYGLTDMGQRGGTQAGETAKRDLPQGKPMGDGRMYSPMPGFEVPWSSTPTAGFASKAFPIRGQLPINRAKFKPKQGIPTQVVGRDNRKAV